MAKYISGLELSDIEWEVVYQALKNINPRLTLNEARNIGVVVSDKEWEDAIESVFSKWDATYSD